ncbi:uncharacterized protein FTOL_13339 [Fusarium torulosum]|uniref:Uncharacterized protein n=1 Tax=Fusarium torulosum TaxID=33205 RepID=A0AAE8MMF6_9HYPO|nr:uncharacterized protein FTOL_13339 [Fusarium torulosum]
MGFSKTGSEASLAAWKRLLARSGFGSLGISLGLLAKMAFIAC